MQSASRWVVLARILRPQGRKGEVLADLFTDFPSRFEQHTQVWLAPRGFSESDSEGPTASVVVTPAPTEVVSHWLPVGRNAGRIVLHLAGIDTIEKAEKLAGEEVIVPVSERLPLEDDAAYVSDLVGCTVYDRGRALGVVEDVQFATSPDGSRRLDDAAPLLAVMTSEGGEILVPFARAYLIEIDLSGKALRMDLPEGLAELNAGKRQSGASG
jgi:16S rRNA processing protein RimM